MSAPVAVEVRSPVRAGQIVDGKYRVDGILGAGGMGVVVSATHLALDEPVALKFMTAEGKADDTARARFVREAKAARKLTSAHVARVFDVGQLETGEPFIVMERLHGDDLAKHLRVHGRLSAGDTVRYVLQVCDAIREAHALGIVHRDLKPQNLFLSERAGSGAVIKVLDFGIAKSLDAADTNSSLTASQNVVGSPIYMSPEQLRASKHVDTRTDIWSIGVIMFELLTGKVPFAGDSVLELGMRIMTVPAPSLSTLRAELPAGLADVVRRCLEKDPDDRFLNIEALASDLRSFGDVSQHQLPFADTMDEARPAGLGEPEHGRTGGEFVGTNRGVPSRPGKAAWSRAALAVAIPAVVAAAVLLRPHASPVAPPPISGPPLLHASVSVSPETALVRVDGDDPRVQPFVRDLPVDGRTHVLHVEAEGFEPVDLTFRDAPPPSVVTLKPLAPAATVVPTSLSPSADVHPPQRLTPVRKGAPATPPPSATGTSSRAPAPSAAASASAAPPALRTTTNDSPIVR